MKASIVAVGSELLSGQITNRNAAWISAKLFDAGIDTDCHLTVDDVESEIVEALDWAARRAELVFVTGGLGPTSDDLTRQAVARWAGQELSFHAPSWAHIETIFSRFSADVPETNRQQCYFPTGASVLENAAGTANAFALAARGKRLWVLPGPPREVETIWKGHVAAALTSLMPEGERKTLRMWRTVGKGESHLAELVEPLVRASRLAGEIDVAYRAHAPFVETKLRFPAARAAAFAALCQELESALAPWLYESDHEDLPTELARRLGRSTSVDLYDGATQGHLLELLAQPLREHLPRPALASCVTSWESYESPRAFVEQMLALDSDAEVRLAVAGFDESGTWAVGVRAGDARRVVERPSLYKGDAMQGRNRKAIAALTVKAWHDLLDGDVH